MSRLGTHLVMGMVKVHALRSISRKSIACKRPACKICKECNVCHLTATCGIT